MLGLWPLAAGAGAVWLLVRWREQREFAQRAAATPNTTATGYSAPAASGSFRGAIDDYDAPPMVQFPGTFDEYSEEQVNVGGDLPAMQEVRPPLGNYREPLVDAPEIEYRDVTSAQPVARVDDDVYSIQPYPLPRPDRVGVRPPRLQPDHGALPRREREVVKAEPAPVPKPPTIPRIFEKIMPRPQPKKEPPRRQEQQPAKRQEQQPAKRQEQQPAKRQEQQPAKRQPARSGGKR